MMTDPYILLVPVVLAMVVATLSFAGCSTLVYNGLGFADVHLTFTYTDVPGRTISRVVFFIRRPDIEHVTTPVLIHQNMVMEDHDNSILWSGGAGEYYAPKPAEYVDVVADKDARKYSVRITRCKAGGIWSDWIVTCRAFVDRVKDDEYYTEAHDLIENRMGSHGDGWPTLEAPFVFNFELSAQEPYQVIALPQGPLQVARPRPDVFLEFDRGAEPAQILKVVFRISVLVTVGALTATYDIVEGVSDLETHLTHEGDSILKTFFSVTGDESGSNATGKYRMSIRNAPVGEWSVTCEGYDSAKPAKTVKPQFPPGPDPAKPTIVKRSIAPGPPQPTTFKFKLIKSGTGAGKVIVPA